METILVMCVLLHFLRKKILKNKLKKKKWKAESKNTQKIAGCCCH